MNIFCGRGWGGKGRGRGRTFVGEDEDLVLGRDGGNLAKVGFGPVRPARVRWVVEKYEGGVVIDRGLQRYEVDLPVLVREQVVVTDRRLGRRHHRLVRRKEGSGEEDILGRVGQDGERHLERPRRTVVHHDVVLRNPPVAAGPLVEVVGDGLTRIGVPNRLGIAVRLS